mmetsp:Transcript_48057/g.134194  ORF Transcript_48057/g.134194 Transcript_48057/m.134194 type:complete len:271 (+) Transcript_48057:575-1387(+)
MQATGSAKSNSGSACSSSNAVGGGDGASECRPLPGLRGVSAPLRPLLCARASRVAEEDALGAGENPRKPPEPLAGEGDRSEGDRCALAAAGGAVWGLGALEDLSWKPNSSAHMKNSRASARSTRFNSSPSSSLSSGSPRITAYCWEGLSMHGLPPRSSDLRAGSVARVGSMSLSTSSLFLKSDNLRSLGGASSAVLGKASTQLLDASSTSSVSDWKAGSNLRILLLLTFNSTKDVKSATGPMSTSRLSDKDNTLKLINSPKSTVAAVRKL